LYGILQLDIITRTISILENRLTLSEDRISTVIAYTRGLGEVPISNPSHAKTSAYLEFERTDRERYTQAGSTINSLNAQAVSGVKQGQGPNQGALGSQYNSKLFDDRSYDETHKSNILRNEESYLKNVLRNDLSSVRNMLRPDELFSKVVPRNDDSPLKNVPQQGSPSRNIPRGGDWTRSSGLRDIQVEDECVREEKRQSAGENMGYYYSDNDDCEVQYVGKKSPMFPRRPMQSMQEQSLNDDEMEEQQEEQEDDVEQEQEGEEGEEEEEQDEESLREKQPIEEQGTREQEYNTASYSNEGGDVSADAGVNEEAEAEDQDEPLEVGQYADSESGDEYYTQEDEDQQADDDGEENTYDERDKLSSAATADGDSDAIVETR
jgi:hypothetical protein